jgi:hypothetical protein
MKIFARQVVVTPQPKNRRQAVYTDLVCLDHGSHSGEFALIDPLCPPNEAGYIKALLSPDEALQRLQEWEHQDRADRDGNYSGIFPDGQKWLKDVANAT